MVVRLFYYICVRMTGIIALTNGCHAAGYFYFLRDDHGNIRYGNLATEEEIIESCKIVFEPRIFIKG